MILIIANFPGVSISFFFVYLFLFSYVSTNQIILLKKMLDQVGSNKGNKLIKCIIDVNYTEK